MIFKLGKCMWAKRKILNHYSLFTRPRHLVRGHREMCSAGLIVSSTFVYPYHPTTYFGIFHNLWYDTINRMYLIYTAVGLRSAYLFVLTFINSSIGGWSAVSRWGPWLSWCVYTTTYCNSILLALFVNSDSAGLKTDNSKRSCATH